ncbi:MAG TPA: hypothetical protein VJV77_02790 [Casimicrobiaceae bacterium]|nr:hypothetical protein [Casimicrobiaceae bacterium]
MRRHTARWVRWLQVAVGVSIVGALGFAVFVAASGKPQSTLYITLGELRSRAAESLEIARGTTASRLTANFVRAQVGQLAPRIASLRDDLEQAETQEGDSDARAARPLSERLLALTQELAERADTPSAATPIERELRGIVNRLVPLARSARPG